jgi:thioredoxin-related protein
MSEIVEDGRETGRTFRSWFLVLVVCVVVGYGFISRPATSSLDWDTDFEAAMAAAGERETGVLVEFTMHGCVFCVKMEREVLSLPEVAEAVARFEPVQLQYETNGALAERYGVDSFPTFLVLGVDGELLARRSGYMPAGAFMRFLTLAEEGLASASASSSLGP